VNRRSHGVNLDDGTALTSPEELERLFVDARPDSAEDLRRWLLDPDAEALIVAGQIGTGKTTLIANMLTVAGRGAIRVEFDQIPIDDSPGAFLAVLMASTISVATKLAVDLNGVGIEVEDFGEANIPDWQSFFSSILNAPSSLAQAESIRGVYGICGRQAGAVRKAWECVLDRIESKLGERAPIIAEGVDKFQTSRAGYVALADTLDFMSEHKVLFEANATHLFEAGRKWTERDKLFIGPMSYAALNEMFRKRMGGYAPMHENAFPSILEYAGGNARQGLRLLNGYHYRRVQRHNGIDAALAMTMHRVAQDLLQLGFGAFPAELLAIMKRDGFAEAALFSDPPTRDEARIVFYRNWAILDGEPTPNTTRWPLRINPLVSDAIAWERCTAEPAELAAARKWAEDHSMSPMGLSASSVGTDDLDWSEVWDELASSESSEDEMNIVGLLEEVASSLFSDFRQDRVVISYRDSTNLDVAVDFLVGKALSYGPFMLKRINASGGDGCDPIAAIQSTVVIGSSTDIYCVFLDDAWTEAQLQSLDRMRDRFANCQMLWFVSHASLLPYLEQWPQLRQLMRFYVLEDDFLSALSAEEIRADLEMLQDLGADREDGIGRLQSVLEYMKQRGSAS
jgi:hypothetical protein